MTSRQSTWLISGAVSVMFISAMVLFVDLEALQDAMLAVNPSWILIAIIPLTAEALITSFRIKLCADHPVPYRRAIYSNAWYVMWLSVLPARLGEIAAVEVFRRVLTMSTGSAIASIIVQRLYDLIILTGLALMLLAATLFAGLEGALYAIVILTLLMSGLATLPKWLDCGAKLFYGFRTTAKLGRLILRSLLQARTWYRHRKDSSAILWLSGITLLKWIVNLIAVVCLFTACGIELGLTNLMLVVVLMHFLTAIPIQTIGGFGVVEVGLAGMLISLGISTADAVATSLILRIVSLSYVAIFFSVSFFAFKDH